MSRTKHDYYVEGVWMTGNTFGDHSERLFADALRDFNTMKAKPAVKSVRLIKETRTRQDVRTFRREREQG